MKTAGQLISERNSLLAMLRQWTFISIEAASIPPKLFYTRTRRLRVETASLIAYCDPTPEKAKRRTNAEV